MSLSVLVVGGGGREHALAWVLSRSPLVKKVYSAPGNVGTGRVGENVAIAADDATALLTFAQEKQIGLTIVDTPSSQNVVEVFDRAGQKIFAPTSAATQLETSKAFAKTLMRERGIPTTESATFEDYTTALRYLADVRPPVVLKADGMTAGKGVFIAEYRVEAQTALRRLMIEGEFGKASDKVVIEEYLGGKEVTVLAFTDGKTIVPMPPSRSYKHLLDDDEGARTESMGVYAPLPELTSFWGDEVSRRVLQPAVDGMRMRGTPYVGVLSATLMLTPYGFKTIEFKCGFDDVEAQALLPLLETDLAGILLACVEGRLAELSVRWHEGASAAIVLTSKGYPEQPRTGLPISGLLQSEGDEIPIFHMDTGRKDEQLITAGGRVLTISARGEALEAAVDRAYQRIQSIHFEGMHYRRDIGRALDD